MYTVQATVDGEEWGSTWWRPDPLGPVNPALNNIVIRLFLRKSLPYDSQKWK